MQNLIQDDLTLGFFIKNDISYRAAIKFKSLYSKFTHIFFYKFISI